MPVLSTVRKYKPEEVDLNVLAGKASQVYGKQPFKWQLDIALGILCGEDVIVDVGTGSGKTLCFSLPLLLDEKDINIIVSPLTALMVDQAESAELSTVAVCTETMSRVGPQKLYEDIVNGKFRQVIVSPEIVVSESFRKEVLSKKKFHQQLRAVCVDEAHCISLWGGSFRPDYAGLGVLRGRFPSNVPFVVASATLPEHILDDIKRKLRLSTSVQKVSVSNARPNVALSVRAMQHSEESKGDLRFLIPKDAKEAKDIPITLVYCNQRVATEDATDRLRDWAEDCGIPRNCIAFYHAKVGSKRKREIEEGLRKGEIRILLCTDAVGMGCDMRNVVRVILWALPPSFCALVQRAGRAARDFQTLGEAILIVSSTVLKKGTTEDDVQAGLNEMIVNGQSEAENRSDDVDDLLANADLPIGLSAEVVGEEGMRVQAVEVGEESEPEDETVPTGSKKERKKKFSKDTNSREAKFLSMFVCTKSCRRKVWDVFFENEKKIPLQFPTTTSYNPLPNTRCCDNCEPRLFEVEKIKLTRVPGLKRGKKKQVTPTEVAKIREGLVEWRETDLLDKFYPGISSLSGQTILSDDVVEKIATCGEHLETYAQLRQHVRWAVGHQEDTDEPNEWGKLLMDQLSLIYQGLAETAEEERQQRVSTTSFDVITPESFYASSSTRGQGTGHGGQGRGSRRGQRSRRGRK